MRERQPKVFIHCAWRGVLGGVRNEAYQISENVPLTIKAVELAHASGCRQWIGLGSQAEYGNLNRRLDESAPTTPTTAYGRAKLAAGIAALGLAETLGLRGAWLRVFSTYGPGDAPQWLIQHVVREFLAGRTPQLTRCEQLWDYLYVADAARAIVSVANGETTGVFNLGSGRAVVLKELIETIRKIIGSTVEPDYGAVPYRPDQVMHLEADIGKLQAATGWFPTTSFEAGLRATVAAVKPG